ncbi:hypothetical protein CDG81_19200 [Actinopolyspora erythraea]|nr:hypothetical protein CDG81_19200 [Actinopolyspora erythraea]
MPLINSANSLSPHSGGMSVGSTTWTSSGCASDPLLPFRPASGGSPVDDSSNSRPVDVPVMLRTLSITYRVTRCSATYTGNSSRKVLDGEITPHEGQLRTTRAMGQTADVTEEDPGPVVQRILLGAELREARENSGLSTSDATKRLGWYAGKLSKVEQGDKSVTDKELAKAIDVFGIARERADALKGLAAEARRKLPPARVPEWATKYVNLIAAASELKLFFPDSFPGTVQTFDYAHAMLSGSVVVSRADVERMAEERVKRAKTLLNNEETRFWLIVGEEALHRQIGGKSVLREQLEQVRQFAESPNATVQMVPFDGGAHTCHGTSFTIITLLEGKPSIVYTEGLTGSDYLGREHVRVYNLAYDNLRAVALSPQKTLEAIERRIGELT